MVKKMLFAKIGAFICAFIPEAARAQISRNLACVVSVTFIVKLASIVPWFARGLIAAVFLSAVVAEAEPASFISTLSEENRLATGVAKLSADQVSSLEFQIQRELAVARQGNTPAFSTSFSHRRTPQQRKEAGLDQLMTPEIKRLDDLVAAAVATKPTTAAAGPTITQPATITSPSSDWVEVTPRKLEVHGEVSLTYMWGSGGRSGYGGSIATTVSDPAGKFALTVVLSQFQFNGTGSHHPGEYGCDRGW